MSTVLFLYFMEHPTCVFSDLIIQITCIHPHYIHKGRNCNKAYFHNFFMNANVHYPE